MNRRRAPVLIRCHGAMLAGRNLRLSGCRGTALDTMRAPDESQQRGDPRPLLVVVPSPQQRTPPCPISCKRREPANSAKSGWSSRLVRGSSVLVTLMLTARAPVEPIRAEPQLRDSPGAVANGPFKLVDEAAGGRRHHRPIQSGGGWSRSIIRHHPPWPVSTVLVAPDTPGKRGNHKTHMGAMSG